MSPPESPSSPIIQARTPAESRAAPRSSRPSPFFDHVTVAPPHPNDAAAIAPRAAFRQRRLTRPDRRRDRFFPAHCRAVHVLVRRVRVVCRNGCRASEQGRVGPVEPCVGGLQPFLPLHAANAAHAGHRGVARGQALAGSRRRPAQQRHGSADRLPAAEFEVESRLLRTQPDHRLSEDHRSPRSSSARHPHGLSAQRPVPPAGAATPADAPRRWDS